MRQDKKENQQKNNKSQTFSLFFFLLTLIANLTEFLVILGQRLAQLLHLHLRVLQAGHFGLQSGNHIEVRHGIYGSETEKERKKMNTLLAHKTRKIERTLKVFAS